MKLYSVSFVLLLFFAVSCFSKKEPSVYKGKPSDYSQANVGIFMKEATKYGISEEIVQKIVAEVAEKNGYKVVLPHDSEVIGIMKFKVPDITKDITLQIRQKYAK